MKERQCHFLRITRLLVLSLFIQCNSQLSPPYLEIYPPVDISQDQERCFPNVSLNKTCPLFVSFIVSLEGSFVSTSVIPGVQVALDQINADPTILPGYSLHYTLQDSKCDRTQALYALHTELMQKPTKIASIGAGCSVATEATAEVSYFYNITQISCTPSSPILSDRTRFQRYFQLTVTHTELAYAYMGIIKVLRWRRVSIILQEERLFTDTIHKLKQLMAGSGIEYSEKRFRSEDGLIISNDVFEQNTRIYVLAMYETHANSILCKASKAGYKYPGYFFVTYGWYSDNWWKREEINITNCTIKDREEVLLSTIVIKEDQFLSNLSINLNYSAVLDNGLVASEYLPLYHSKLSMLQFNISNASSRYDQHCYDAIWAIAYALNSTVQDIDSDISLQNELLQYNSNLELSNIEHFELHHFTYNNSGLMEIIFRHLEETNFFGVTGQVKFDRSTGVRGVNFSVILQYQLTDDGGLKQVTIGHVNHTNKTNPEFVPIRGMNISDFFPGGLPYDGVASKETVTMNIGLTVVFCILSVLGIIFAIVCIVFNFLFRKKRLLKLSSVGLNFIIAIGGLLIYVSTITFVVPTTNKTFLTVHCNLSSLMVSIGFSLSFGTIVLKMGRIYYIFQNPRLETKDCWIFKDKMLATGALLLAVIDLALFTTYLTVEGLKNNLGVEEVANKENTEDDVGVFNARIEYVTYICTQTKGRDVAFNILYGYKAVLLIIGLIFTISIRKVRIKGLDDSTYIGLAVYVTSIASTATIASIYVLSGYVNGYPALWCSAIFIGTSSILLLVFIPKMFEVFKDPDGDTIFEDSPVPTKVCGTFQEEEAKFVMKEGHAVPRIELSITNRSIEARSVPNGTLKMETKESTEQSKCASGLVHLQENPLFPQDQTISIE